MKIISPMVPLRFDAPRILLCFRWSFFGEGGCLFGLIQKGIQRQTLGGLFGLSSKANQREAKEKPKGHQDMLGGRNYHT